MTDATQASPGADVLGDRLRAAREDYGISLRELARRVGVSASLISQIENGKVRPSVGTLYAIASELGASVDELLFANAVVARPGATWADLLTEHPHTPPVQRRDDRQIIDLDSGIRWERLTTEPVPGIDFLYIVYPPGGESAPADAMQQHTRREWGYIIDCTLNVTVALDEYALGPGDAIAFDSTVPHRLYNESDQDAHAIWFVLGWQPRPTA